MACFCSSFARPLHRQISNRHFSIHTFSISSDDTLRPFQPVSRQSVRPFAPRHVPNALQSPADGIEHAEPNVDSAEVGSERLRKRRPRGALWAPRISNCSRSSGDPGSESAPTLTLARRLRPQVLAVSASERGGVRDSASVIYLSVPEVACLASGFGLDWTRQLTCSIMQ